MNTKKLVEFLEGRIKQHEKNMKIEGLGFFSKNCKDEAIQILEWAKKNDVV